MLFVLGIVWLMCKIVVVVSMCFFLDYLKNNEWYYKVKLG